MNFAILQAYQASLEAAVRDLAAKQLASIQAFADKQKEVFTNPTALTSADTFTKSQVLVQDFVTANQAFISASLLATQTFWRDQVAENQATLQAAGVPSVSEVVERVQAAVEKTAAPAKTSCTKR